LGLTIVVQGILVGIVALSGFGISRYYWGDDVQLARAVSFCALVYDELLRSLAARSNRKTIFQLGWFGNPWLLGTAVACGLLQLVVILTPGLRGWFQMPAFNWHHWVLIGVLSLLPITVVEVAKLVRQWTGSDNQAT
jgi:Ca2+-transporting ATPase